MNTQVVLLILSLVTALVGTLAKTRDDKETSIRRRVRMSGWIIVSALLVSFCLTVIETVKSGRENRVVKAQNEKLNEKVSLLVTELAKNSDHVSTLLDQQGTTSKHVSSLVDQLGETQMQLTRERSATVLTLFEGWEIVKDVEFRIEALHIEKEEDRPRAHINPFWFTPGLSAYSLSLITNDRGGSFLSFKETLPTFDPAKDEQAFSAYVSLHIEDLEHYVWTGSEDYMQHNFTLAGPKTLSVLLYELRAGWGTPLIIKLTYREPPAKQTVEDLRRFVTNQSQFQMQFLAPIEKKSKLVERRRHWDRRSEAKNPVYWRVNIPLAVDKVESGVGVAGRGAGVERTANDVTISVRIDSPFIEQDYDQESGP